MNHFISSIRHSTLFISAFLLCSTTLCYSPIEQTPSSINVPEAGLPEEHEVATQQPFDRIPTPFLKKTHNNDSYAIKADNSIRRTSKQISNIKQEISMELQKTIFESTEKCLPIRSAHILNEYINICFSHEIIELIQELFNYLKQRHTKLDFLEEKKSFIFGKISYLVRLEEKLAFYKFILKQDFCNTAFLKEQTLHEDSGEEDALSTTSSFVSNFRLDTSQIQNSKTDYDEELTPPPAPRQSANSSAVMMFQKTTFPVPKKTENKLALWFENLKQKLFEKKNQPESRESPES